MEPRIERYHLSRLSTGVRIEMRQVGRGLAFAGLALVFGGIAWWGGGPAPGETATGSPRGFLVVAGFFLLIGLGGALVRETLTCERGRLRRSSTLSRPREHAGARLARVVLRRVPTSAAEVALLPWHVEVEDPGGGRLCQLQLQDPTNARRLADVVAGALAIPLSNEGAHRRA